MMRGGTLLILGHWVKGQGQIKQSVLTAFWTQYRLQFFAQSPSKSTCELFNDMMTGRSLLILGHEVKGKGLHGHSVYKDLWAQ